MLHVNFIQVKDSEDMGRAAADEFEAVIQAKPSCVIGLATGSTPIPLYRELILRERAGRIDFSRVRSVNLDEYMQGIFVASCVRNWRRNLESTKRLLPPLVRMIRPRL